MRAGMYGGYYIGLMMTGKGLLGLISGCIAIFDINNRILFNGDREKVLVTGKFNGDKEQRWEQRLIRRV